MPARRQQRRPCFRVGRLRSARLPSSPSCLLGVRYLKGASKFAAIARGAAAKQEEQQPQEQPEKQEEQPQQQVPDQTLAPPTAARTHASTDGGGGGGDDDEYSLNVNPGKVKHPLLLLQQQQDKGKGKQRKGEHKGASIRSSLAVVGRSLAAGTQHELNETRVWERRQRVRLRVAMILQYSEEARLLALVKWIQAKFRVTAMERLMAAQEQKRSNLQERWLKGLASGSNPLDPSSPEALAARTERRRRANVSVTWCGLFA